MKIVTLVLVICSAVCFAAKLPQTPSGSYATGRIVNGSEAANGQFPYIVSYQIDGEHYCGGSIIAGNFVITAGHCCEGNRASTSTILAGTNSLIDGGIRYQVKDIHLHPDYIGVALSLLNDICLLEIESEIELIERVQIVKLNEGLDDSAQDAIVAGWGDTWSSTVSSDQLQWLPTRLVPYQECVDLWGGAGSYPIRETHVCAFIGDHQGACNGDSGGPLITLDVDGNTILTGLVSWGKPCARGYPDVYTKVGAYIEWINSFINVK